MIHSIPWPIGMPILLSVLGRVLNAVLAGRELLNSNSPILRGHLPQQLGCLFRLRALELEKYGVGGEVSAKGDVYSYGVLLLEMFTRKRPINEMFVGELNLHKWVRSAFPNRVAEVVDSCLFPNMCVGSEEREENEFHNKHSLVNSVLHLGLLCTNESPHDRPTMRDIVGMLERLTASFVRSADTYTRLTPSISDLVRQRTVDYTLDSQSGSTS
eukprot:Gb_07416 [translate_table: standard]